jgi:hypothetical protein
MPPTQPPFLAQPTLAWCPHLTLQSLCLSVWGVLIASHAEKAIGPGALAVDFPGLCFPVGVFSSLLLLQ